MQHEINPLNRLAAGVDASYVALVEAESTPSGRPDSVSNFVQVCLGSRSEVVQTDYGLPVLEQMRQQVRANETGSARYQPSSGIFPKVSESTLVWTEVSHWIKSVSIRYGMLRFCGVPQGNFRRAERPRGAGEVDLGAPANTAVVQKGSPGFG